MRTIEAVRRSGVAIEADRTVHEAAAIMEQSGVGALAVLDGTAVVGIVTDRDLVRRALAKGLSPEARIDGVMTTPALTVDSDTDLHDVCAVFRANAVRRLIVLDGDAFVGTISVDDLLVDLAADLADVLRPVAAETLFGHRDAAVPATR